LLVGGKNELFLIGSAQVPSLPGGEAINPMSSKERGKNYRHIFIEIKPHTDGRGDPIP